MSDVDLSEFEPPRAMHHSRESQRRTYAYRLARSLQEDLAHGQDTAAREKIDEIQEVIREVSADV